MRIFIRWKILQHYFSLLWMSHQASGVIKNCDAGKRIIKVLSLSRWEWMSFRIQMERKPMVWRRTIHHSNRTERDIYRHRCKRGEEARCEKVVEECETSFFLFFSSIGLYLTTNRLYFHSLTVFIPLNKLFMPQNINFLWSVFTLLCLQFVCLYCPPQSVK